MKNQQKGSKKRDFDGPPAAGTIVRDFAKGPLLQGADLNGN